MGTFHVIYDPTDRLRIPEADKLPPMTRFAALSGRAPEDRVQAADIARKLATLLFDQLD